MPYDKHKWYIDHTSPGTAHIYGIENFVKSFQTRYQQVEIADSEFFGRLLILDGKVQSAEYDEYIYHEALVHPAMLMGPVPRRVLVIGGGEGATLREVLKHPSIEELIMVDLDQEVVELCRKHLRSWHQGSFDDKRVELFFMDAREYLEKANGTWHQGSFDDKRVELFFMDAREYLEKANGSFDVIISDVPEPVEQGPAVKLFSTQFFELIKANLTEKGTFALQAGDCSLPFIDSHSAINNTINKIMPCVLPYRAFVPSFNTEWGFILASPSNMQLPALEQFNQMIAERKMDLYFFDGETAKAMFSLPLNLRKRLNEETKVIDDQSPLTVYQPKSDGGY